jgi:ketosteroid isomerase-like protein
VFTVRIRLRTSLVVALVTTFLISSLSVLTSVNDVRAATGLQLKWAANLGLGTYVGPLAAYLIPGTKEMQIVVTGVSPVDHDFRNGSVAVLNGSDGSIMWKVDPGNMQDHSPFEIADLNNDGIMEIVVANLENTLVLYGNNGSTYWKNTAAPSYFNYPVVFDVNGDGYLEVFVCSGSAPYVGVDYITELSHDGQILAQTETWHPCWGGLAIGDPYFNGTFILVQGDRSTGYNPENDTYKYGGWGVRVLDAKTLTPIWNDSSVITSSNIPMLVDVNGDSVLEVVATMQDNGLAVYNALNGTVLSNDGIYRKNSSLGLNSHSQPTIYFDSKGEPQLITCHDSNPEIWNLKSWNLTATLNVTCFEPPKLGRVTADQQMDIIAVDKSSTVHVYNQNFEEVDNITLGSSDPSAFTLVQDVDGDGYNELLMTSRSGTVYCYSTPALTLTPSPRSNVAFYSEYRLGVAEYVEPPGPKAPQIRAPLPLIGAMGLPTNLSTLSVDLFDYQRDPMNYTVTTTPNIGEQSGINVPNGRYNISISNLAYSTIYSWTVSVTDGKNSNATTFSFTTVPPPPDVNNGSMISSESPPDGATGVAVSLSTLSFDLTNFQGNPMNYTVSTMPNIGGGSGINVLNGRYSVSLSSLGYSTTYLWVVSVTDGDLRNATTFTFTTQAPQLTIQEQIQGIKYEVTTLVSDRTLSRRQGRTLETQLDNANENFSDGKNAEAIDHLRDFINQVNRFVKEDVLTQNEADKLVIPAEDAIDRISALVLPGDLNGDKIVNIYDAVLLADKFHLTAIDPAWDSKFDLKEDGMINIFDALVLSKNFGKSWT